MRYFAQSQEFDVPEQRGGYLHLVFGKGIVAAHL